MTKGKKNNLQDEAPPRGVPIGIPSSFSWTWAGVCVLIVLTTAVYWPALGGGELLDDDLLLTQNQIVKSPSGLYQFWFTDKPADYWPATNSTFWIEWRLWGEHLTGYHVTNLALHLAESLLVWLLLRKLGIPGAFWGALLFAVHPVNVESVAWIASRKNLVAMLFLLLSLWWYLNGEMPFPAETGDPPEPGGRSLAEIWERATAFSADDFAGGWYWLSFAAFVLAMLGKGSAVVMPALLLCILWWKRPLGWRDLRRTLPFFAAGAGLTAVNVVFQTHDTAERVIRHVDLVDRVLGAGGVVWFYLYKAILPFDLAFIYPTWNIDAGTLFWWIPLLAAAAVTIVLLVTAKPWRAERNRVAPFWFAWLFFGIALLPVMGLCDVGFMKYALVADRYLHVALLAVVALAAAAIGTAWASLPSPRRWVAIAPPIIVIAVFAFLSWRQAGLYVDRITLFEAAKEKNPDSWMIHHTLGIWKLRQDHAQEAIPFLLKAIQLHTREDAERGRIRETYACALSKLGRTEDAIEELESAFEGGSCTPTLVNTLRSSYRETDQIDKLLAFDLKLTKLHPRNPMYHNNYGSTLIQTRQIPAAIQEFGQALTLDPRDAEACNNLGAAYWHLGDVQKAGTWYERALMRKPDYAEAHRNLGALLFLLSTVKEAAKKGDALREATHHLEEAVRLKPDYVSAQFCLAKCYHAAHQDDKARVTGRMALEEAQAKKDKLAAQIERWLANMDD